MLWCKQGPKSTDQHTALQQKKKFQQHSLEKMFTVQLPWVTKLSGLLLYVPSSTTVIILAHSVTPCRSCRLTPVSAQSYFALTSHGFSLQPEQRDVVFETSGKLLASSSMTSRCLQWSISVKKTLWEGGFFTLSPDTRNMDDLLFYSCLPTHLSLESKAGCISHWLHQSTFSLKGQPISFVWTHDYSAEGTWSGLPRITWPPTAHSDTVAPNMTRQPHAVAWLVRLVPRCTAQPHPHFRKTYINTTNLASSLVADWGEDHTL